MLDGKEIYLNKKTKTKAVIRGYAYDPIRIEKRVIYQRILDSAYYTITEEDFLRLYEIYKDAEKKHE